MPVDIRKTHRIQVRIRKKAAEYLKKQHDETSDPVSTIAGNLLESAIKHEKSCKLLIEKS